MNATVIALAKAGKSYDVMAYETGLPRGTVAMIVYRARQRGEDIPRRAARREKINRHLPDHVVAEIHRRASDGQKVKDIARDLALPVSTIAGRMAMLRAEGRLEYRNYPVVR